MEVGVRSRTPLKQTKKVGSLVDKVTPENYLAVGREHRIGILSFIADTCTALMAVGVGESEFRNVIQYCRQESVIDDGRLAEIGGVEKSSANRWLHGKAAPRSSVLRKVILQALVEEVGDRVKRLKQGRSEVEVAER